LKLFYFALVDINPMKKFKIKIAALAIATLTFNAALLAESFLVQDSTKVKKVLQPMLPSGVQIDSVTPRDQRSVISGTAASNADVSNFMRKIDSSLVFTKLELESIKQEAGRVQYVLSAQLHCPTDPSAANNACKPSAAKTQSVYKCVVNGSTVFQSKPCKG